MFTHWDTCKHLKKCSKLFRNERENISYNQTDKIQ